MWRKADILADCALMIINDEKVNGKALLDEDYMRARGITNFEQYRCDPDVEPPRIQNEYVEVGQVGDPGNSTNLSAKL